MGVSARMQEIKMRVVTKRFMLVKIGVNFGKTKEKGWETFQEGICIR
jgi:hypothetical protein